MIQLSFSISNPFLKRRFDTIYDTSWGVSRYKHFDFSVSRDKGIISASFGISARRDHAGFDISFGLLTWNFDLTFYDSRHWDNKTGTWEVYPEEEKNEA